MIFSVSDDRRRIIELTESPRRIVSLVPCVTELIGTLGAANRLVGVTRYCPELSGISRSCVQVGGTKDPDCHRIIELRPDLVIISPEENRREDFDHLCAAGVGVFVVEPTDLSTLVATIERFGTLLENEAGAAELRQRIAGVHRRAIQDVSWRVSVFCPIWRDPWISFSRRTYAGDLLHCAGGDNIYADELAPYPRTDLDEIARRAPQVILLPDEPYRFRRDDISSLRLLTETPAWRSGNVHLVDGRYLFWYGVRTAAALASLSDMLRQAHLAR